MAAKFKKFMFNASLYYINSKTWELLIRRIMKRLLSSWCLLSVNAVEAITSMCIRFSGVTCQVKNLQYHYWSWAMVTLSKFKFVLVQQSSPRLSQLPRNLGLYFCGQTLWSSLKSKKNMDNVLEMNTFCIKISLKKARSFSNSL